MSTAIVQADYQDGRKQRGIELATTRRIRRTPNWLDRSIAAGCKRQVHRHWRDVHLP